MEDALPLLLDGGADALFREVKTVARKETVFEAFYAHLAASGAMPKLETDAQVRTPGGRHDVSPAARHVRTRE